MFTIFFGYLDNIMSVLNNKLVLYLSTLFCYYSYTLSIYVLLFYYYYFFINSFEDNIIL